MRPPFRIALLLMPLLLLFEACQSPQRPRRTASPVRSEREKPAAGRLGWAIQAGAFSQLDNAVRFSESLNSQGLDSTYFRDSDKLYKVRFGNFTSRDAAQRRAESLRSKGVLEAFYLVAPESLPGSKIGDAKAETGIRKSLVATAESYRGNPYTWGGTPASSGFDCSGLTQAVYRLNGLSIPRSSKEQHAKGKTIRKEKLRGGDLVFFASGRGGSVNHVGMYIGNGIFIHAPKPGTVIRKEAMSNPVLSKQYVGSVSYL
jgi:cell wall-associated NlpC family hydrolase